MTTRNDQNFPRPDLPEGVDPLFKIKAKPDPKERIKTLATDIEHLLRELQTDFRCLPDGTKPGLGERVGHWGGSSDRVALRRALGVRNDVVHALGRSTADDIAEAEPILLRTLEEVLSDAQTNPNLADIVSQIRGGLPIPRGVMSSTWEPSSRWNPNKRNWEFGVTIISKFWVSGMRGEEGCIAPRFFDGLNNLPLPAFASGTALPFWEPFVQKLGGYSDGRQQFIDFDHSLRAPGQPEIGWRELRYRLGLWRRPNPQAPWILVSESGDSLVRVCVPGVRVLVSSAGNSTYNGQAGLRLQVSGTVAGLRERRYVVGALFYDDAGNILQDFSLTNFPMVSIVRSFTASEDVSPIECTIFMPYDALPTCRTSPKYKCRVGVSMERAGSTPPCPIEDVNLPLIPERYWVLWVSDYIRF